MFNVNWSINATIAMVMFIPLMITVKFFEKNYGIPYSVSSLLYAIGVPFGIILWRLVGVVNLSINNTDGNQIITVAIVIMLVGVFCGSTAGLSLYDSITQAPNPGLPVVVANVGTVLLFILSYFLYLIFPTYYPKVEFDITRLLGIVIVFFGITFVILGKKTWTMLANIFH